MLGHQQLAIILARRLFFKLRQPESTPCWLDSSTIISERQKDVLEYIAGSILRKIKNRKNVDHNTLIDELRSEEPSKSSLIALKSREGMLTVPNSTMMNVCMALEIHNRQSMKVEDFFLFISKDDSFAPIKEIANRLRLSQQSYDAFYELYVKKFLRVRSAHECKHIMEKYRRAKRISKWQMALRRKLAMNS